MVQIPLENNTPVKVHQKKFLSQKLYLWPNIYLLLPIPSQKNLDSERRCRFHLFLWSDNCQTIKGSVNKQYNSYRHLFDLGNQNKEFKKKNIELTRRKGKFYEKIIVYVAPLDIQIFIWPLRWGNKNLRFGIFILNFEKDLQGWCCHLLDSVNIVFRDEDNI